MDAVPEAWQRGGKEIVAPQGPKCEDRVLWVITSAQTLLIVRAAKTYDGIFVIMKNFTYLF